MGAESEDPRLARGQDDGSRPTLTSTSLGALAHDNTVLECNLRDYELALRSALQEAQSLRFEMAQMENACGQVGKLRELLQRESKVRQELQEENTALTRKGRELTAVIR